jgi:hypothetical protein
MKEIDGARRIKTNHELDELIRYKNIINYIKAQGLTWFGHLHRMPEERMVKRVYKWKPMLTRPLGRPKKRWEFHTHGSVHRRLLGRNTNKMQLCNIIYYSNVF